MKRILFAMIPVLGLLAGGCATQVGNSNRTAMPPVKPADQPTLKKIVAVSRFDDKAHAQGLGSGMSDQLTDALMQSGQFVVMERQNIKDVIVEDDFANSGRVQKSKSAQSGKIVSAQILVQGTITEFESSSSGSDNGISIAGIKIRNKRGEAHIGLIIRLIDTTTGEVLASERVEGKATSGGIGFGVNTGDIRFGSEGFKKTPTGKAVQIAIDNAVAVIANKLKNVPFEARVVKVNSDSELLVSGGTRTGIAVGNAFTVYSVGEGLVDPTTGEQLGSDLEKVGTVKTTKVEERYAKVVADASLKRIKVGDIIRAQ